LQREPRILFLDIETAPIIMAAWTTYEANAVWVERDTFILSFAAKWAHERSVKTYALPDYSRYKTHKHDDKHLVRDLRDMLDAADIVVAHNGDAFDIKKIRSRMLVHRLQPPSHFKTVDTLKVARTCKFDSNKLDNLGRYLQEGRKIPNTGAALWRGCCAGDAKSWRIMRRYNAQDVLLLERVYERLKPWMPNHPNLNLYTNAGACPTCQSDRIKRRGLTYSKSMVRQRWQCLDCWSAWSGQVVKPGGQPCESESSKPARATSSRAMPSRRKRINSRAPKNGTKTRSTGAAKRRRANDRR
jgi:hypothetical protein